MRISDWSSDVCSSDLEPSFKEITGQGFVIQYKPGAGGAAAWSQLNSMTADGNTIMGFNLPHLFLQPMTGKVGYETDDITVVNVFTLTTPRSEERRVGKECGSTCRSRGSPDH